MAENTIIVRTANGLRLRGKQTFGSDALFADELLVFLKQEGEKEPSGIALIPVDAEQLEVQVHSDWTSGVTVHYNDVSVVWERVLVDDNADSVKQLLQNPVAVSLADYQWASRQLELLQIIAGTAIELAENTGLGKELHIQTILGEMIQNIEVLKAFIYNAEEEGALNEAGLFLPAFTPVRAAKQAGGGFIRHALEVLERVSQTFLLESPDPSQAQQQVSREVTSLHNAVWSLVGSGKAYRIKQHESYTFGDLIEQSTLFYEQYNYSYYKELYKKFWRQAAASVP
nr:4-hydroxyphenylacetate 3-hydroxylase C-terminal domain-containing protein [Paenibacillus roseus]